MKKFAIISILATLSALSFGGTMTLLGTGLGQAVTIAGVQSGTFFAGKLSFNETSLGHIQSVCVDLEHVIHIGQSWPDQIIMDSSTLSAHLQDAAHIVAAGFNEANTNDKAAGLQLAVWEAVYDDGVSFNTGSGSFKVTNASSGVLSAASTYYAMKNGNGNAIYIQAMDGCGQSQMTAVPEPTSLLGIASVAIAAVRRKRK
ncbi:MAG: PEP-CTERM sorting domain-containing protein [Armatimonadetes bacterium]|nr:PEP-CTERM sorting domain-containing protein [Armatimonadota bacterium]